MVVQELLPRNFQNRLACYQSLFEAIPEKVAVFFSNETHFYLLGCINKYLSVINHREFHERPIYSLNFVFSADIFIGPYFYI